MDGTSIGDDLLLTGLVLGYATLPFEQRYRQVELVDYVVPRVHHEDIVGSIHIVRWTRWNMG
jgi:hypothetical protein